MRMSKKIFAVKINKTCVCACVTITMNNSETNLLDDGLFRLMLSH